MRVRNGLVFVSGPFFNTADAGGGAAAAGGDAAAAAAADAGGADAAAAAAAGSGAAGDKPAGSGEPGAAAAADAGAAAGKPGDAAGDKPQDNGAPAGAPETYDLKLPEGGLLDESDVAAVIEMGKAHGWTNEQAQAALTESAKALDAQRERFLTDTKAHPEIGGAKLEAAQIDAKRALDKFLPDSTPEGAQLRRALDKSGYGNYAPLTLLLARIGKQLGEDAAPQGSAANAGARKKSHADVMFGGSK